MKRKAEQDVNLGIEKMYKCKKLENSMLYKTMKAQHEGLPFDAHWGRKELRKESENTATNQLIEDNYLTVDDLEGVRKGKALYQWQESLLNPTSIDLLHSDLKVETKDLGELKQILEHPGHYTEEQLNQIKQQIANVENFVGELKSSRDARHKGQAVLNAFLEQKVYKNGMRAEEFANSIGKRYRERNEYEQAVKDYKDKKE